jgi:hypothetical protein
LDERLWWGKLKKKIQHVEDLQLDVEIILKWILHKWDSLHGVDEGVWGELEEIQHVEDLQLDVGIILKWI